MGFCRIMPRPIGCRNGHSAGSVKGFIKWKLGVCRVWG